MAKTTKYSQLAETLRARILSEALRPGDQLPSFAEMRVQFGASPLTVDRVYSTLEKDGLVVREQGRGTFVAVPPREVAQDRGRLIGLLVPYCIGDFFSRLIQGVEDEAQERGFRLVIANSRGDVNKEPLLLQSLAAQAEGLCIFPSNRENFLPYAKLMQDKVPFVFVDQSLPNLQVPLVSTDNFQGGYLATRHLLEIGRRQIWVLSENAAFTVPDRIRGYRRALQEAGIPFDPNLVRQGPTHREAAGYSLTSEALPEMTHSGPFGIFAINDSIARGAYLALKGAGLRIPNDVAVVGFDDADAAFFDPPLSSVRQDLDGMGRGAVRLLCEEMRSGGKRGATRSVLLEPRLTVRNSSDTNSDFCTVRHILHGLPDSGPGLSAVK